MYKLDNMSFDEAFCVMRQGWAVSRKHGWMAGKYSIEGELFDRQIFFTIEDGKLMKYEKLHFGENRWVKNESFIESGDLCATDWYIIAFDWE